MKKKCIISIAALSLVVSCFLPVHSSFAGVTVYDAATSPRTPVKLKALTKGRLFPEGGKLVKFYVNEKHIGTTLSGGDGYAYLEYLPLSAGIKHLKVEKGFDTDEGILMVAEENNKVVLIEIEGSLFESFFTFKPAEKAKKTVKLHSRRFTIIYMTSVIGHETAREWLQENDFFLSSVLKWGGRDMLSDLKERGLKLYAIVGSPAVLSEAPEINKRLSFQETEDGIVVKDWNELLKQLR